MANRLTESRLKQIIREETARLTRRPLRESFSYGNKLSLLMDALDLLQEAQSHELASEIGSDPDLDSMIESLEGLIEAVEVLAAEEDRPPHEVEAYPTSARLPRSMRH